MSFHHNQPEGSGKVLTGCPVEALFNSGEATLVYANGISLVRKDNGFGVHFFGSDGEVMVNRGQFKLVVKGETIASFVGKESTDTSCDAETRKAEQLFLKDAKIRLDDSPSHYLDFLASVRSRIKPIANEQVGGRTAICCHMMNQLYYHNETIKWDPARLCFTGGTGNPAWFTIDNRDWSKVRSGC